MTKPITDEALAEIEALLASTAKGSVIATAYPETVRALIARIRAAEAEVDHFGALAFVDLGANPPVAWKDRALAAEAERDRLRTAMGETAAPFIIAAERERCAVIAEMGAKGDCQTRDPEALMQELAVADYAAAIAQAIRSGE